MPLKDPESPLDVLRQWRSRQRTNQRAHYRMAEETNNLSFRFGVAATIISGVVGVLILIAVRFDPPVWLRITIGCLSIVGAAVGAIATSAKWSDKSAQHHAAGSAYGAALRRIEQALVLPPSTDEAMRALLDELRKEIDAIPIKAPPIPRKVWETLPSELMPADRVEAQPIIPPDAAR